MARRKCIPAVALSVVLALVVPALSAGGASRMENALWGAGVLWDTVITPTSFKQPPSHSIDLLYNFSMSGLTGQRSVSASVPGDPEYNGGRWWVQMAVFTDQGVLVHDPDGDGMVNFELMSAEEVLHHVELGHIDIFATSTYFECPLLPSE